MVTITEDWLNGKLKIPVGVLFDKFLIPQLGPVTTRTPDRKLTVYADIHDHAFYKLRDEKDIFKRDLARQMLIELFNRGYLCVSGIVKHTNDPWVMNYLKHSGFIDTTMFKSRKFFTPNHISKI